MIYVSKIFGKLFRYARISCFKSLWLWLKCGAKPNVRCTVYPKSIVQIDPTASIEVYNGEFQINASWLKGRQRRNISELILSRNAALVVEDSFELYQGASIFIGPNAKVRLKGQGFINTNSVVNIFSYLEIGKGTIISDDVRIQDSDNHHIIETINGEVREKPNTKPIIIGDHVWIGKNVVILKGVDIGDGAVVAAGSVVIKDVPSKCIVAGNPAKVVRENVEWR